MIEANYLAYICLIASWYTIWCIPSIIAIRFTFIIIISFKKAKNCELKVNPTQIDRAMMHRPKNGIAFADFPKL